MKIILDFTSGKMMKEDDQIKNDFPYLYYYIYYIVT